ncbi:MAG: BlaI/MecI/CopY family transcriptional regulator [Planctomycetota bacterium]|nr:BlaI/MecI/CopY family transcriptional regulator [Planctomycetota bacterium]
MARPKAKELTERELEVMQIFWDRGESTAADVREAMAEQGRDLAYTTVATLVRILLDKDFLTQTTTERPFRFVPARTFEEVSGSLLGDMVQKVFAGSRMNLLVRLFEQKKLTAVEQARLQEILNSTKK